MPAYRAATIANPSTPASGTSIIFPNSTNKEWQQIDDSGKIRTLRALGGGNTVVANAANTYLTGTAITVPPQGLAVGASFYWEFFFSKTGAGVATPIWTIVYGTNGSTADAARATYTLLAQTAVIDTGWCRIVAVITTAGASGIMQSGINFQHNLVTTGLANAASPQIQSATSSAFDLTPAGSIIGVCCNPGASGVWTFQVASGLAVNI